MDFRFTVEVLDSANDQVESSMIFTDEEKADNAAYSLRDLYPDRFIRITVSIA